MFASLTPCTSTSERILYFINSNYILLVAQSNPKCHSLCPLCTPHVWHLSESWGPPLLTALFPPSFSDCSPCLCSCPVCHTVYQHHTNDLFFKWSFKDQIVSLILQIIQLFSILLRVKAPELLLWPSKVFILLEHFLSPLLPRFSRLASSPLPQGPLPHRPGSCWSLHVQRFACRCPPGQLPHFLWGTVYTMPVSSLTFHVLSP